VRFLHTADWQIGKPFARIADERKRSLVQQERVEAIKRIGRLAAERGAELVLVAGDVFDSSSACRADVSSLCSTLGQLGVPVVVIPGNHDAGGPGSLWRQEFFSRERAQLAPNLHVLLDPLPLELDSAVILPCPLVYQAAVGDPTEWLRDPEVWRRLPAGKPRLLLAHGSVQSFSREWDDEDESAGQTNLIDLTRLPQDEIDYVALGDWHGTKQVGDNAWYSGTPESDRFLKGGGHDPGNVLMVEARRGSPPLVEKVPTGRLRWTQISFDFSEDAALEAFESRLALALERRANEDLLRLALGGSLGLESANRLRQILESLEARTLWLKLEDRTRVAPSEDEIRALTESAADPLVAQVAGRLAERAAGDDPEGALARVALRELHSVYLQERAP
jgi:DNA repair exonuclease SbcCD nuclease subunit